MKKILGLVVLLALAGLAEAGMVTVYSPAGTVTGTYATIQAGVAGKNVATIQQVIDACETDGTVSVATGNYNKVVYINKGIALKVEENTLDTQLI